MLISKMLGYFQFSWVILVLILGNVSTQNSISTIPSTNIFATNYSNLIVRARFAITDVTASCSWRYYDFTSPLFVVVVPSVICISVSTSNETITCSDDGTYITSNLTLLQPLSAGSLDVSVACDTSATGGTNLLLTLSTITVQDCPSNISSDITVEATSYIFNAQGTFKCSNNRELFYSNGTRPSSSDTICLASATWSGQDNLQCWSAPTVVTLGGDLPVIEGNDLNITCHYVDTTPSGTTSIFYVGDVTYTKPKNEALVLQSLQPSDNNKTVSCQAVTSYTQIPTNNNTGRSSNLTITVLYFPNVVNNIINSSEYVINTNGGYLLRSDQNLTMNCNASESNPMSECMWTVCIESDSCANITDTDKSCQISLDLNVSSSVFCSAFNVIGSMSSNRQNVAVIPLIRSVSLTADGSNITVISQLNESIIISCYIANANELNTTYTLHLPNNTSISDSSLTLPSLQPSDTGNYTCKTNDTFGSFEASTYLDVKYAPFQDMRAQPCRWAVNQTGSCPVEFFSNPPSAFTSLTLNETSVVNDGSNELISSIYSQTYYYNRTNVTSADNGTYKLTLNYSSMFPTNISITFDVDVPTAPTTTIKSTTTNDLGLIIGVSCAAAVIVILIILFVIMYMRKRKAQKNKDNTQSNPLHRDGNGTLVDVNTSSGRGGTTANANPTFDGDTEDEREERVNPLYGASMSQGHGDSAYAEVGSKKKKKKGEKEEKINPLYTASSEPVEEVGAAYAEVDVKRKKKDKKKHVSSEKEEKINPLYAAPSEPVEQVGAAYAEVDVKKKKKKNKGVSAEKEEKINPLYAPSDQPEQIDAAYAEVDVKKKKKQNGKSEKEEKINPLYAPSEQPEQIDAAYAEIDMKKKKKQNGKSAKEEKINPLHAPSVPPEQIGATYAEVDMKKKKKKVTAEKEGVVDPPSSSSRDHVEEAYAAVDKNKKKPKLAVPPPPPPGNGATDITYSEVKKPKIKKKPLLPDRSQAVNHATEHLHGIPIKSESHSNC